MKLNQIQFSSNIIAFRSGHSEGTHQDHFCSGAKFF